MKNNWICKNCGAEVPATFEVCWNCELKIDSPPQPTVVKAPEDFFYSRKDFDLNKITQAGKQLKNVGRTIAFLVFLISSFQL